MSEHMFVVTGGPGSGKSSLIATLAGMGMRHMPEAGRAIIKDQVRIGGHALPWDDRAAYAELMLGWELRSHAEASAWSGPVLMDRGAPDVLGYLTLCGLPVPAHVRRAAELYRYNRIVFVAPYWEAIFAQDAERKQDKVEAQATCAVMETVYGALGYQLVHLPLSTVAERAEFVLKRIGIGPVRG